jgi:hypothetical protein
MQQIILDVNANVTAFLHNTPSPSVEDYTYIVSPVKRAGNKKEGTRW